MNTRVTKVNMDGTIDDEDLLFREANDAHVCAASSVVQQPALILAITVSELPVTQCFFAVSKTSKTCLATKLFYLQPHYLT